MEKLHDYQGLTGRFHQWKDNIKESYNEFRSERPTNIVEIVKSAVNRQLKGNASANNDFSHVFR